MRTHLADFVFRLMTVLGSALVLQFFSEFYFLNEGPSDGIARGFAALPGLMVYIYVYGLFAWLFHIVLDRFRVHDLAGLMLAGSLFGWATEALVVPVVYEGPPVSFFFPSVGWHALIDVLAGWYLMRLAMRRLPLWPLAGIFLAAGVFWGLWATWTWSGEEEAPVVFTLEQFRNIVLVSSTTWIAGTLLADFGMTRRFRATVAEIVAMSLIALLFFVTMGLAYWPWMLALTALIGLTLAALWRGRAAQGERLENLSNMPGFSAYLVMPLLPAGALLTYPLVLKTGWALPAQDMVLLMMLAGALGYFWAIWRLFTSR